MNFFITGTAGFIGYHLTKKLLSDGHNVVGIDNFNDYYDVNLKECRSKILSRHSGYTEVRECIEKTNVLKNIFQTYQPEYVIHLAGQAGVRYSLEAPDSYINSNILGTFELLEAAKIHMPKHLLIASTSSAYGANVDMPYSETQKTDHQVSIYAATKKAIEILSHSYSHLYSIPVTAFRFFTVYGPYGRPDMAPHKFTSSIMSRKPIDIYNFGEMRRDFTYIDDLVEAIHKLTFCIPELGRSTSLHDSISPVAPWRVVNIGNSRSVSLLDFIDELESAIGIRAIKNFMPIQPGDVEATWADTRLLKDLTSYIPDTKLSIGIPQFVSWYRQYYGNSHLVR